MDIYPASLISDKVRVVNKDGIPVKGQTGMKAQFLKGKGKKEVYKTLARKRAVKKAGIRYYKRSRLKKKGLMRLIPNGMKKSIGIPFLLAGSAATAACGVMIPFSSVPLLNPNSAITNDHLSIDDIIQDRTYRYRLSAGLQTKKDSLMPVRLLRSLD